MTQTMKATLLPQDVVVYRGGNANEFSDIENGYYCFTDKTFMSTTFSKAVALHFMTQNTSKLKKNGRGSGFDYMVLLELHVAKGTPYKVIRSDAQDEYEMLLLPFEKFYVRKVQDCKKFMGSFNVRYIQATNLI